MQAGKTHSGSLGYIYVVGAAVLWAASGSVSKFLFKSGVTPFHLVQFRTTIAASLLLAWMIMGKRGLLVIERKDLMYFFLLGLLLAATQFSYLYAISRIQVAAAILLQYQVIAVYAVVFNRRRFAPVTMVAIAGAVLGCYLMVGAYDMDIFTMNKGGIMSGPASAVAFACYSLKSEHGMRTYSPWTVLCYALIVAGVVWNVLQPPLAAFRGEHSPEVWAGFSLLGCSVRSFPSDCLTKGSIAFVPPAQVSPLHWSR